MKHKEKVRLARRLREKEAKMTVAMLAKKFPAAKLVEIHRAIMKKPIFQTQLWELRLARIERRVDFVVANQQLRAEMRREKKKNDK